MIDVLANIERNMNARPSEVTDWRATMHDARAEIKRLQCIVDLVMAHDSNLIDHLERQAKGI